MATPTPTETPDVESLGEPLDPPELESAGALESPGALESFGAWTALPSAVACAFACAELSREKRPVVTMTMPSMTARAITVARVIATAAATDTPPDDVSALGCRLGRRGLVRGRAEGTGDHQVGPAAHVRGCGDVRDDDRHRRDDRDLAA